MTAPCLACGFDPSAIVLSSWSLSIPRALASLNLRIHNGKQGWRYREDRDAWLRDFITLRILKAITPPTTKRRVTLTRVFGGRQQLYDKANVDTKAAVDAMVRAGLLKDDNADWLELHVKQERGTERGTRVLIEELAP